MESPLQSPYLTLEQIGFYHVNGFLIVEDVVSAERCDELLQIALRHAEKDFAILMNLDRRVPEFRALVMDPKVVGMLETLQGKEVVEIMNQMVFKRPQSPYASQEWNPHQDNSYPQARLGTHVTAMTFLADSDPENGGLYVHPGSQCEGLLPYEPVMSHHEKPGTKPGNCIKGKVLDKYPRLDLRTKKGSMLILHGECIHGSHPNLSDRPRPTFSVPYLNYGEPFWPGSAERSDKRVFILHDRP